MMHRKALWLTLLLGPAIQAQDVVPDAGQLLNQQQRSQPVRPLQLKEREKGPAELKLDEKITADSIHVQRIEFDNAARLSSPEQLQAWVQPAIGKKLSFEQLQQVADQVTTQLHNAGYLLARAYLPKQDVTDGVIRIALVQGQLDSNDGVVIEGQTLRIKANKLADILGQHVQPGQPILKADLEKSLLLINDLPGINTQATLKPGKDSGAAKLVVNATEGPLLSGSLWADNFGNRYTGAWRGNGLVNINDPLRIGDQLRLSMLGSEGIISGSANYAVPLMANGLNLSLHYSNLQYQLLDRYFPGLQLEGEATNTGLNLNYPMLRSRALSLWANAGYEHRALRDNGNQQQLSDRQINEAILGVTANSLDNWWGGGISTARLGVVAGNLDRSDNSTDLHNDSLYAQTQGSFAKFTYSLARLQKLTGQWSLFAAINGQQASGNMDSSEKFILGGPNGVRAYPVGEASGDHGWVFNTELRWDVPYMTPLGNVQLVGFVDTGHVTLHDRTYTGALSSASKKNNYQLSGGGLSLNLTQGNRYQLSGTWSAPIGDNPGQDKNRRNADGKSDDHRFWLQAQVWF